MGISNYYPNSLLSKPGVCTSTTRPASPYVGQTIFETDTLVARVWNGTAWQTFQLPNDIVIPGYIEAGGKITSKSTSATGGIEVGATGAPARFYSTAGDNFNLRTHTNTPNPNFSLGVRNGSGTDVAIPVYWENGTLRLRGAGTTTATGIYIDSNNVPRYATAPNPYGWHPANQQLGTEMVIGAYASNGMSWASANSWVTIGSVDITIPGGTTVIEMIYGFTCFVAGGGSFLCRLYYSGTGITDQWPLFRNNAYDHFAVAGTRGLGVVPGVGTIYLQIYGNGITVTADSNDSCYFTVHTV